MTFGRIVKRALLSLGLLLACLPAAFIATVATFPFWRWIEEQLGVEAFGHSGPAEWCYWLVYAVLAAGCFGFWSWIARPARGDPPRSP